ncbi:MAG: glycosyltransferase [Chloroflexi bacterium]|nr:glycosyltransferase [Chloroflexota bacterium]
MLAPRLPWPTWQGTALRNLNILLHLAERHALTLLCFAEPGATPGPLAEAGIEIIGLPPPAPRPVWRRLLDLPGRLEPDLVRRLDSPAMEAAIAALVAREAGGPGYDGLQIEGMEMAAFGLRAQAGLARVQARPPRLVYDAHNAEWLLQDRAWRADLRRPPKGWVGAAYSLAQTAKIRRYEGRLLAAADATVAVSRADAAALAPLAPEARFVVVPNGVDVEAYPVADPDAVEPGLVVFTGKMDFRPNVDAMTWFCQAVWPRVRAGRPEARLAIVGRDPSPRVRALASAQAGVEVTGAVPDVRPWIARAGLVVVPLRVGGGTRLKVLEAMAMGKALVASTLAVEGLDLRPGLELAQADDATAMAEAILTLSRDPARRAALGTAARARAEADYRWSVLVPRIEALYADPPGRLPTSGSAAAGSSEPAGHRADGR